MVTAGGLGRLERALVLDPHRARLELSRPLRLSALRRQRHTGLTSMDGIARVGAVCLHSLSAEYVQMPYMDAVMPSATTIVLARQLAGRDHHPPKNESNAGSGGEEEQRRSAQHGWRRSRGRTGRRPDLLGEREMGAARLRRQLSPSHSHGSSRVSSLSESFWQETRSEFARGHSYLQPKCSPRQRCFARRPARR